LRKRRHHSKPGPRLDPTRLADDARAREVGLRHSSCEAGEQGGPNCCGTGGAEGGGQGECVPAKRLRCSSLSAARPKYRCRARRTKHYGGARCCRFAHPLRRAALQMPRAQRHSLRAPSNAHRHWPHRQNRRRRLSSRWLIAASMAITSGADYPASASHIPYSVRVGNWEGRLPSTALARQRRASSSPILWFGPPAERIPSSRPLYRERRRAQRRSMMARQRHRRLVIDLREHDGILARHGRAQNNPCHPHSPCPQAHPTP